jgi:GAF domain
VLVLRAGAYGPHSEFARVSGRSRFRRGEGLPGNVWSTEQALVWRDLGSHFVRAEVAAAAGIDAALGFPWFRGRELAGVVTLLFSTTADAAACVELWNHEDGLDVLRHGGGLYAGTPELESLSALLQFPYAAGLPGLAWSTGMPVVIHDVRKSNEFVRAELALRANLKRALALPIFRERKVLHVVTLLGSETHPFPRAFELFVPGNGGLVTKARSEQSNPSSRAGARRRPNARELLAQDAEISRMPIIVSAPPFVSEPIDESVPETKPEDAIMLTLPIHDGTRLRGVLCLEF